MILQKRRYRYQENGNISLANQKNVSISGFHFFGNTSDCISLTDCENITISYCKFEGNQNYKAINLVRCKKISIVYCDCTGCQNFVYAFQCTDFIQIKRNKAKDSLGLIPRRQHIQFNQSRGKGVEIDENILYTNVKNLSAVIVDHINDFESGGVVTNWKKVSRNITVGRMNPNNPTYADVGACLQAENNSEYIEYTDNICIDSNKVLISLASAKNIKIKNFKGVLKQHIYSLIGIRLYSETLDNSVQNVTIENAEVNFTDKFGSRGNSYKPINFSNDPLTEALNVTLLNNQFQKIDLDEKKLIPQDFIIRPFNY